MPASNGPGLNSATKAPKSSKTDGFNSLTSLFIPGDSSWNTLSVSPFFNNSKVFSSSKGILLISKSMPFLFLIISRQSLMMVKVSRPRKSIFKSPIFSMPAIGYCVVVDFSFESATGIMFDIGFGAIITPAA